MHLGSIARRAEELKRLDCNARSARPPIPRSAKVELDSNCNLRCSFCSRQRSPRASIATTRQQFGAIARNLRGAGVEQLGLFYINEPFLCEWLAEAVYTAKHEVGFPYVFVTTNGIGISLDAIRECIEAGLDSLKFALNFADSEQLVSAAGASRGIDAVLGSVVATRRIRDDIVARGGHRCRLSASSLRFDGEQEIRMRPLLGRLDHVVDEHYWLPVFGCDSRWSCLTGGGDCGNIIRKPTPCWSLFTEAHVRADGKLSACCLDASERFVVGDLTQTSFLSAWHSDAFRALRVAHLSNDLRGTVCADCIGFDASGASVL